MIVDLHCHTTASDGALSPLELLSRAQQQGVELLAITDHDTVAGYLQVRDDSPLPLLSGVELSCVWSGVTIHVVGLGFDPDHPVMKQGLQLLADARQQRAETIAQRLAKRGIEGALQGAIGYAAGSQLGRPHFAQYLLEQGHVSSFAQAFKRYLGAGKIGDVKTGWPALADAVRWIVDSGGVAVLAHPLHYKMTNTKLRALLSDFQQAGGEAMEVVSGQQQSDQTRYLTQLAQTLGLKASCGSDFHRPTPWSELGAMSAMPEQCEPVWRNLAALSSNVETPA